MAASAAVSSSSGAGSADISAAAVAAAALAAFQSLPKTGSPQPHEHTVLASIALSLPPHSPGPRGCCGPFIVAQATGTKCLPHDKRAPDGSALNDCHAEPLCRRALLRWLYDEIQAAAAAPGQHTAVLRLERQHQVGNSSSSSLSLINGACLAGANDLPSNSGNGTQQQGGASNMQVHLQPGVQLHMFVSQAPCGDAAVHAAATAALPAAEDAAGAPALGRTGAKVLGGAGLPRSSRSTHAATALPADSHIQSQPPNPAAACATPPAAAPPADESLEPAAAAAPAGGEPSHFLEEGATAAFPALPEARDVESYSLPQALGVLRRKPGRGVPTLSMSCSDKLAKWGLLGLQGSLLGGLLAVPLHLTSLTVGCQALVADTPAHGSHTSSHPHNLFRIDPDTQPPLSESLPQGGSVIGNSCLQAAACTALGLSADLTVERRLATEAPSGAAQIDRTCTSSSKRARTAVAGTAKLGAEAEMALQRAVVDRVALLATRLPAPFQHRPPMLRVMPLPVPQLHLLGLAAGAQRRVAAGACVVWWAGTSPSWRLKPAKQPAAGAALPERANHSSSSQLVLTGGSFECITGLFGSKAGKGRQGAAPVPAVQQSQLCKAAMLQHFRLAQAALLRAGKRAGPPSAGAAGAAVSTHGEAPVVSYRQAKLAAGAAYQAAWKRLLASPSPLDAWIPKPEQGEAFLVQGEPGPAAALTAK